jgi:hypothetical protein
MHNLNVRSATYCGFWFTCIHFVYRKSYPFCTLRIEAAGDKYQMTGQGVQHTVLVRLHADFVSSVGSLAILGTQHYNSTALDKKDSLFFI